MSPVINLEKTKAIAQVIAPHPLTIHTVDLAGDKPLPYLNLEPEANPFLGCRGIRQNPNSKTAPTTL